MNTNPFHSQYSSINTYYREGWALSKHSSKAYKIVMLLTLLVYIGVNLSFMGSISLISMEERRAYLFRSIIDPLIFLTVCHLDIRPYLKLKVLKHPYTIKSIGALFLLLLSAGFIFFITTYYIGRIDSIRVTDLRSMQLVNESGQVDAVFSEVMLWSLGILNGFMMFAGWSLIYVMWHQQQSKKELQLQVKKAQMQQLTNQLSPHFLFNTFNSIRALIYEDQDKAADTVTELSELFRVHLQSNLRVKVSLQEEWQVSERYLGIEQIRLEERLTVYCEIEPDLLMQSLPTLTLLTLIENAIKHGISPSMDEGFVRIEAKTINQNSWTLTVTNSFKSGVNTTGTQVGLENIKTRLNLMYPEKYQFSQSDKDNQFKVVLTLPLSDTIGQTHA